MLWLRRALVRCSRKKRKTWESYVYTYRRGMRAALAQLTIGLKARIAYRIGDFADIRPRPPMCKTANENPCIPSARCVVAARSACRAQKLSVQFAGTGCAGSAVQWGFFRLHFRAKRVWEHYVLEPLARELLAKDSRAQTEFGKETVGRYCF